MGKLVNRAKMGVSAAPGTGPITLGGAVPGYQSLAAAGVNDQDVVSYIVEDGSAWELGQGTYSASGTLLARTTILGSSNGGAALSLSSGALVYINPLASDLAPPAGGLVNRFRNGAMDIAQRGTSGSVASGSTAYTLDGWQVSATGAACAWSQPFCAAITGNALRLTGASGLTAVTLQQRIESAIAATLLSPSGAARPVTVQFAIYNNSGAALTAKLATGYASARDNFASVTADLAATNLQTIANGTLGIVAFTFVPSASLINGYQVQLQLGGALNGASGSIDIGQADIRVTPNLPAGLCLAPPPAELRPAGAEFPFNLRYYQQFVVPLLQSPGTGYLSFSWALAQPMRAIPTPSQVAVPATSGVSSYTISATCIGAVTLQITLSGAGGYIATWGIAASAEL